LYCGGRRRRRRRQQQQIDINKYCVRINGGYSPKSKRAGKQADSTL